MFVNHFLNVMNDSFKVQTECFMFLFIFVCLFVINFMFKHNVFEGFEFFVYVVVYVLVKFIQNFINTPIMTLRTFGFLDQN